MKLNPRTAAKQFLRKQENKAANNQKRKTVLNPNQPFPYFSKWGTGGRIIRGAMIQAQITEEYMNRITKIRKFRLSDGKEYETVSLEDNIRNTNKFTNGLV